MRISDWSSDVCSSDLLLLDQGDTLRHLSLRQGGERLAVEKHAAVSRPADAGKQFQQGRFSGSVGSDQPKGLARAHGEIDARSEEHTSELQSLMRISYAVFCLKKKKDKNDSTTTQ